MAEAEDDTHYQDASSCSISRKPQLQCPECLSQKLYKDGLRYLNNGAATQRWLCRDCGHRFSQKSCHSSESLQRLSRVHTQSLNRSSAILSDCQGRNDPNGRAPSARKAVQTLATVENPTKSGLAGATKHTADARGKIVEHSFCVQRFFLWRLLCALWLPPARF